MVAFRILALGAALVVLSGCAAGTDTAPVGSAATTELTVFAAASLTESFDEIARTFMDENPGIRVKTVYDGSSTLATQLIEGAPADVFASADQRTMTTVVDASVITGTTEVFASNTLEIAVAPGNPHGIRTLADLAAAGRLTVLCAPQVPCGASSATLLAHAGVHLTPVSEEQNVRAVVTKVALGEADAGLVYTTDVAAAAGSIDGVPISGAAKYANNYLIGKPDGSTHQTPADSFIRLVLSDTGQTILSDHGFGPR